MLRIGSILCEIHTLADVQIINALLRVLIISLLHVLMEIGTGTVESPLLNNSLYKAGTISIFVHAVEQTCFIF